MLAQSLAEVGTLGFSYQQGKGVLFSSTVPSLTLSPTQSVLMAVSLVKQQPGHGFHSHLCSAKVRNVKVWLLLAQCFIKWGTVLPFISVAPKLITLQFTVYGEIFLSDLKSAPYQKMLITEDVELDEVHIMLHTNSLYSGDVWIQYI